MTEYDINCKETLELAGARTAKYFQIVAFLISIIIGKNRDISIQILHKMPNWCLLSPRAVGGGGVIPYLFFFHFYPAEFTPDGILSSPYSYVRTSAKKFDFK